MREKSLYAIGVSGFAILIWFLYRILFQIPDEVEQGAIYRIIFYHVPSSFTASLCYFSAMLASIAYLVKRDNRYDSFAVSATEVGLAFAAINLITGMIWGRIIWGIWWAWDARLTWALITWLVYFGYLVLRKAIDDPTERAKITGVLSIFSFVSVMITFKAIVWWRTQHPGPVLSIRNSDGVQRMDPAMESMMYQNWIPLLMIAFVFVMIRWRQEEMQREIEAVRRFAHAR